MGTLRRRIEPAVRLRPLRTDDGVGPVPPVLHLRDDGAHPIVLREAVSAGEPLNPEVIARVRKAWGITIRDGYGQTETTAQVGNTPAQTVTPGSMGRPLPGYGVVLVDLSTGEPGDEG